MDTLQLQVDVSEERLERVAFVLKTIAHPLRINIIHLLSKHEALCVNDICEKLSSEQSLTSHHLSNLKHSGVLKSVRKGKQIFYYLKMKEVLGVLDCMNANQDL
ncbi:MAG: metalloregulator ArsR/SmtB family transcription factor [Cytophagales bacterium]|nr:metalloregulator ArsR/SmtB family transcription factor [Cytophagales bacterium]